MIFDRTNAIVTEMVDLIMDVLQHSDSSDPRREAIERGADRFREEIETIELEAACKRLEGID
jgi:hypothetical protein